MLYSVFPELINMSLTAAAVILIVALLRPLLHRAPRAVTFLLWAVVLFRLVCPVSFSADFSLLRAGNTVDNRIQYLPTELIEDTARFSEASKSGAAAVTESAADAFTHVDFSRLAIVLGTWVWVIGIAVFLAYGVISLIRLRRRCIGAVRISGNTYLADGIQVPFVMGILRPRIYLPSHLAENEQKLVLQHEAMHIRRGDPFWKLIAFLALALHWFNPVAWLGFNLFVRDMETACDEHVLARMDENDRADYAATLLNVAAGRRFPSITPAFGEENPKTRIKSILRYKKPLKIVTVIAVVFAVAAAVLLFVNPTVKTGPAAEVIPEFPLVEGNFFSVSICNDRNDFSHGYGSINEENRYLLYSSLQNLQVEVTPASQSRSENRVFSNSLLFTVDKETLNEVVFHFNSDFSRMWIENGVKPSYTYVVAEPDSVRELFMYVLTGETENVVLDTAIEANRIAAETEYMTAVYCPAAQKDSAAIKVGTLHAGYVSEYLCTKSNWPETILPIDTPSSPESVEFVIEEDLRVQIWKKPRLAVIRQGENERWFKTSYNDYSEAVDLVLNYCLTPAEAEEVARSEAEETADKEADKAAVENSTEPSVKPTMSPTPEPTSTPDPSGAEDAARSKAEETANREAAAAAESTSDSIPESSAAAATPTPTAEPTVTPAPTPGQSE